MDIAALSKTTPPWLHIEPAAASAFADALNKWERASPGNRIARIVRGRKCVTVAGLFDEFAAALQFPPAFGENWDALADCLRDWYRFPAKAAITIGVIDADKLLLDAPVSRLHTLTEVLTQSMQDVNAPIKPGKPRPFHVVLQCAPSNVNSVTKHWKAAGLVLET